MYSYKNPAIYSICETILSLKNMVKGGTNIKKFSTATGCKKKGPVRSYVADTSMEVDITTVNDVSITDAAATTTSNIIGTTVEDGEIPGPECGNVGTH